MLVIHYLGLALLSWITASWWFKEKAWTFRFKSREADAFNGWLQNWQFSGLGLKALGDVPRYKFFGKLAEKGLRHARTFGSFPKEILWEWREGIVKEKKFEEQWLGVKQGAYVQFLLFTLITWIFITVSERTLNIDIRQSLLIFIGLWQLLGFAVFSPVFTWLSHHKLSGFALMLETLYVLRSLSGAGLSTTEVLKEAQIDRLGLVKHKSLEPIIQRIEELAATYQKQGGALSRETQLLLQEVWFLREEVLGQLVKTAEVLKLIFLIIFFAGGYFAFLGHLLLSVLS